MADQDFKIEIKTLADLTGIRLTQQQLTALQNAAARGNQQAIAALRQLTAAQKEAAASFSGGIGGYAIGVGTIVTVLTAAISKVKEFNAEQDRMVDGMIKSQQKMRELGEAIVETQDKMISQRRTATEPLEQSYIRLQQEIIKLKTEQDSLNLPAQGKEWQDLQQKINAARNELQGIQSDLEKKGITDVTPAIPGPKAGKGESQALVDEIERNRRAAEEQSKEDVWEYDPETGGMRPSGRKQFPTFQPPPAPAPPPGNQYPSPIGPPVPKGGNITADILVDALTRVFDRYWGR